MEKIVFVGIILVSGLFSLQYSLMGTHGDRLNQNNTADFTAAEFPNSIKNQVVYICPDDTAAINKLHKTFDLLLWSNNHLIDALTIGYNKAENMVIT